MVALDMLGFIIVSDYCIIIWYHFICMSAKTTMYICIVKIKCNQTFWPILLTKNYCSKMLNLHISHTGPLTSDILEMSDFELGLSLESQLKFYAIFLCKHFCVLEVHPKFYPTQINFRTSLSCSHLSFK